MEKKQDDLFYSYEQKKIGEDSRVTDVFTGVTKVNQNWSCAFFFPTHQLISFFFCRHSFELPAFDGHFQTERNLVKRQ